jgi:hypothetical protein
MASRWLMAPAALILAAAAVLAYVLFQQRRRARKAPVPEVLLAGTVVKTEHGKRTTTATVRYLYGGEQYEDTVVYSRKGAFFHEGAYIPLYLADGRVSLNQASSGVDVLAYAYLAASAVFLAALAVAVWAVTRGRPP